jgi:predicted outer membrane protein
MMKQIPDALIIVMVIGIGACTTESDKAKVEKQNDERFVGRVAERNAQFVVDVLDASYGLMEVAQVAEDRSHNPVSKGQAKEIVEAQTSMIVKLKAYAEFKEISIPFSGPARTRNSVKRLYDKKGEDFETAWRDEIEDASGQLERRIIKYQDKSDVALDSILNASLMILRSHRKLINQKNI